MSAPQSSAPRFKVGDRVRVTRVGFHWGLQGSVEHLHTAIRVNFDNLDYATFAPSELTPLSASTDSPRGEEVFCVFATVPNWEGDTFVQLFYDAERARKHVEALNARGLERGPYSLRAFAAAPRSGLSKDDVCSCAEWEPSIKKLDGPIITAQARNPHLANTPEFQFTPFRFCPWCGMKVRSALTGKTTETR